MVSIGTNAKVLRHRRFGVTCFFKKSLDPIVNMVHTVAVEIFERPSLLAYFFPPNFQDHEYSHSQSFTWDIPVFVLDQEK
jgi:hypothetical protein